MAVHLGNNRSYDRKAYTVPAESVFTIDFNGLTANFFRVNNMSNVTLYFGTASYPNKDFYDFKASPNSVANFCEPVERQKLYIANTSKEDAKIILVTWADVFDATFMAVSEITLNHEGSIQTDGTIKSFETELPSGDNNIGKVTIANPNDIKGNDYKTELDNIIKYLSDGNNSPLIQALNETATGVGMNLNCLPRFIMSMEDDYYLAYVIKEMLKTMQSIDNKTGTGASGKSLTAYQYFNLLIGSNGERLFSPEAEGFPGFTIDKFIGISEATEKENIFVEVPVSTNGVRETAYIPYYEYEKYRYKQTELQIRGLNEEGCNLVVECSKTITDYELVDSLQVGDKFLGVIEPTGAVTLGNICLLCWDEATEENYEIPVNSVYNGEDFSVVCTPHDWLEIPYKKFIVKRG